MSTTSLDPEMRAVVQAISQYSPSFMDEIQGCTPAEISKLQAAVGRPLPVSYAGFLHFMGHSTGPLELFKDSDFSFTSVLEYYFNKKLPRPPERYILFGLAEDDPYYDFYLDCGSPDPQVVRFPTPETAKAFPKAISQLGWLASSLYEFVFSKAYFKFHLSQFPHRHMLAEDTEHPVTFEQAESLLKKLNFTRHPQSSKAVAYYDLPTSAVTCNRFEGSPMAVNIAAHSPRELARISDILEQHLRLLHLRLDLVRLFFELRDSLAQLSCLPVRDR